MADKFANLMQQIFGSYFPVDITPEDEDFVISKLKERIASIRPPGGISVIRIVDRETIFAHGTDEGIGTCYIYEENCPKGDKHEPQVVNDQEVCCKCNGIYQREKIKRRRFDADYKEIIDAEEDRT